MIDIFFDYFGYDKEHLLVSSIAYEYDDYLTWDIANNHHKQKQYHCFKRVG